MTKLKLATVAALLSIGLCALTASASSANDLDKTKPEAKKFHSWVHRVIDRNTATINKAQDAAVKAVDKANAYTDKEQLISEGAAAKKTAAVTPTVQPAPAAAPLPKPAPQKKADVKKPAKKVRKAAKHV